MPTWPEIQEYVRSKYTLQNDDEHRFALVFEFDNGRTQLIGVRHYDAFDKDWIEFRSVICKEAQMSHRVALKKNDDFVVGAISLDEDGDYCFIYSVCLETLDPDEFELPLHVVARTADKLEADYSGDDEN
ncbi:hypothetical protein ACNOYE_21675 [Nannocystaceae bacterium ST9]